MVKVGNAVILAAGASTRFIPLSLEQPKGLYEVKGEPLLERQIRQLREAGIKDITLVLGYKKEMFYYLLDKYDVDFVYNPDFLEKNNIESLYLVKDRLKDTYICSSDDYFVENPFKDREEYPFYAGCSVDYKTSEMYVDVDADGVITKMEKNRTSGDILLGHSFWTAEFSEAFKALMEENRKSGKYDRYFWEILVKDNLDRLPAFHFKRYPSDVIYEFDYFEELRNFDRDYVENTHSLIISNICSVFGCLDSDVVNFRTVNEGLTNTSFIFNIKGTDYIYRHPGDGTEKIINRRHEKTSLEKARDLGIDPTYIHMDFEKGWKVGRFVRSFREPSYSDFNDSRKVIDVLRRLHASGVEVDYGMKPWEDATDMEILLKKKDPGCFEQYEGLKKKIGLLVERTRGDGVKPCFCHGDTYRHNWMIEPDGNVILIDWEYSGMSDPGVDVGYYIVDAGYDFDQAKAFIREYLREDYTQALEFHHMAYTAIIAYYWFVWAMYRKSCGALVDKALQSWLEMAVKYSDYE